MSKIEVDPKLSKTAKKMIARKGYTNWRQRSLESKTYIAILFAMCRGKCPICEVDMILSFTDEIHNRFAYSATLDHVDPLLKNGEHNKLNLTIMCKSCNGKKGSNDQ